MSRTAYLIVDDDEFNPDDPPAVPGFARTYSFPESALDDGVDERPDFEWLEARPQIDTVYVEHPVRPAALITLASFHRLVFEDKACEAIELAAELGARRIEAEHLVGWGRDMAASFGLPRAQLTADRSKNAGSRLLFAADYEPAFDPPAEDDQDDWVNEVMSEYAWLPFERTWQTMLQGRLDGTLRRYSLLVTYESDHDINASLAGGLARAGFSAGGRYVEFERTSWRLDVEF